MQTAAMIDRAAVMPMNQPGGRVPSIAPFELSQTPRLGTQVGVVSYGADREQAPSLQQTCDVLGHQQGVLIMSCDVDFGSSGAPVFRNENGIYRLVSVVSAMAEIDGAKVSIGTDLAGPFDALQAAYDTELGLFREPPSGVRIVRPGERTETGALFVRP